MHRSPEDESALWTCTAVKLVVDSQSSVILLNISVFSTRGGGVSITMLAYYAIKALQSQQAYTS